MAFSGKVHHMPPCLVWWAYIPPYKYFKKNQKCFFLSHLQNKWHVPIVGLDATNDGHTYQEHYFGCNNVQLLRWPAHSRGVLLRLWKTVLWFAWCDWWMQGLDSPQENMQLVNRVVLLMVHSSGLWRCILPNIPTAAAMLFITTIMDMPLQRLQMRTIISWSFLINKLNNMFTQHNIKFRNQ